MRRDRVDRARPVLNLMFRRDIRRVELEIFVPSSADVAQIARVPKRGRLEHLPAAGIRVIERVAGRPEDVFVIPNRLLKPARRRTSEVVPQSGVKRRQEQNVKPGSIPPIPRPLDVISVRLVRRHAPRYAVDSLSHGVASEFRFVVGDRQRPVKRSAPTDLVPVRVVFLPPAANF